MLHHPLEVDLYRLLHRCECIAAESGHHGGLKGIEKSNFESYVAELDTQMAALHDLPKTTQPTTFSGYAKRISYLKSLLLDEKGINATCHMNGDVDSPASQGTTPSSLLSADLHRRMIKGFNKIQRNSLFSGIGEDIDHKTIGNITASSAGMNVISEREQLMNNKTPDEQQNTDVLIKQQQERQEQYAAEMQAMVADLKHHSQHASDLIKRDVALLDDTAQLAHAGMDTLQKENIRLKEHATSHSSCWIYLSLVMVSAAFIGCVLLIRFTSKRTRYVEEL